MSVEKKITFRAFNFFICIILLIAGATKKSLATGIEPVVDGQPLIVITTLSATTYQKENDRVTGLEYEMTTAFANYIGADISFKLYKTTQLALAAFRSGEGDILAAGLLANDKAKKNYLLGPAYQWIQPQAICHRDDLPMKDTTKELPSLNLVVTKNKNHIASLQKWRQIYPDLSWTVEQVSVARLMKRLNTQGGFCTVVMSNNFELNRRYYPKLYQAFGLSNYRPLRWYLPKKRSHLHDQLRSWFMSFRKQGKMDELLEYYYSHLKGFSYSDILRFQRRIKNTLPKYQTLFKKAAQQYDIDWLLLAAQAYQESHWDPMARSPTGVRGMMMLTQTTAKQLGVDDRLDLEASIFAGAKYLSKLRDRLPDAIAEPDRTWLALAAYNIGYGHLRDARNLAQSMDVNPNDWRELEEVILMLEQERYYQNLQYGYADGGQAVHYVNNIRNYYNILLTIKPDL